MGRLRGTKGSVCWVVTDDCPQEDAIAELCGRYPVRARAVSRRCQRPLLVSYAIVWAVPSVLLLARHTAHTPLAVTLLGAIVIVVVRDLSRQRGVRSFLSERPLG